MKKLLYLLITITALPGLHGQGQFFRVNVMTAPGRLEQVELKYSDLNRSVEQFNRLGLLNYDELYRSLYHNDYAGLAPISALLARLRLAECWSDGKTLRVAALLISRYPHTSPRRLIKEPSRRENYYDLLTPMQLLYYGRGDCDSKSLALLIILKQLGYDSRLLLSEPLRHVVVEVKLPGPKQPLYIDSTIPGLIAPATPLFVKAGQWRGGELTLVELLIPKKNMF